MFTPLIESPVGVTTLGSQSRNAIIWSVSQPSLKGVDPLIYHNF